MKVFRIFKRAFLLAVKFAPTMFALYILLLLLRGSLSGITTFVNQLLFDSLTDFSINSTDNSLIVRIIVSILLLVLTIIFERILTFVGDMCGTRLNNRLSLKIQCQANQKISQIDAQEFEDPAWLNKMSLALGNSGGVVEFVLSAVTLVFHHFSYFIVMSIYLFNIEPILLFALLFIFLPVLLSQGIQAKAYIDDDEAVAPFWRLEDSFYFHAMDVRETRLYGLFGHFKNLRLKAVKEIYKIKWKTSKKIFFITLSLNILKILGWCGVLFLLFKALLVNKIEIGAFAAVLASINTMFSHMEGLFGTVKNGITSKIGGISLFFDLLDKEPGRCGLGIPNISKGIAVSNISFSYPESDEPVINNLSININVGETIALVGANGSGKTTLAKLLCGLYIPDYGEILINGLDTRRIRQDILFDNTSAVFQDYRKYPANTLAQNVSISRYSSTNDVTPKLESAEIPMHDNLLFENGLDTVLSREFGGTDISKGQWQRIAMARGLYRNHDIIIFDEPTAAIDPFEETRMYKQFAKHSQGKTTILVTHRLGSVRNADRILVMDQGRIMEDGTHDELLQKQGIYADMWNMQAKDYL